MDWMPIETAPKDGRWVLVEGEMAGGDTSCVMLGRYEPKEFDIGDVPTMYEWRLLEYALHGVDAGTAVPTFEWYSEGRISGWMPLPNPPTGER